MEPKIEKLIKRLETDEVGLSYKFAVGDLSLLEHKAVEPLAEVLLKNPFKLARLGAADALGGMDRSTFGVYMDDLKEKSRLKDVLVEALRAGLSDKEKEVRDKCADGLFTWLNSASPGVREKTIKELVSKYDELDRNTVINDLRNADYFGISKGTKKEVLDFLVAVTEDKKLGHLAKDAERKIKESMERKKVALK
ncbi:MAG: hypothetical protein Sv326_1179 [Candidatus Fermentimicrarchaeum limneticum]|uniref:HEAT repeat domain-containing protein n=1 Tax=Fermentimicrarchaeum limneticum TaxID=2795018 RepID=A0A7D5XIN8_FERL1|nr:MAG: hypothetical protein Sv326_1179 [Candidatus Fermentimicrarchaeum limneticum]